MLKFFKPRPEPFSSLSQITVCPQRMINALDALTLAMRNR